MTSLPLRSCPRPLLSTLTLLGAAAASLGCGAQADPTYEGEALVTLHGRVEAFTAVKEAELGVFWMKSEPSDPCSGPITTGGFSAVTARAPGADYTEEEANAAIACMRDCEDTLNSSSMMETDWATWESCIEGCDPEAEASYALSFSVCASGAINQTVPTSGDFPANFTLDVLEPPPPEALLATADGEQAALGYFLAVDPAYPVDITPGGNRDWVLGASPSYMLLYAPEGIAADSLWGRFLGGAHSSGYHVVELSPRTSCDPPEEWLADHPEYADDFGSDTVPDQDASPTPAPGTTGAVSGSPEAEAEAGPAQETEEPFPSYEGYADVCGNGICEAGEDCDHCSDCTCSGESTHLTNSEAGFMCMATFPTLVASPDGLDTEIDVLITDFESLRLPEIGGY